MIFLNTRLQKEHVLFRFFMMAIRGVDYFGCMCRGGWGEVGKRLRGGRSSGLGAPEIPARLLR